MSITYKGNGVFKLVTGTILDQLLDRLLDEIPLECISDDRCKLVVSEQNPYVELYWCLTTNKLVVECENHTHSDVVTPELISYIDDLVEDLDTGSMGGSICTIFHRNGSYEIRDIKHDILCKHHYKPYSFKYITETGQYKVYTSQWKHILAAVTHRINNAKVEGDTIVIDGIRYLIADYRDYLFTGSTDDATIVSRGKGAHRR